MSTSAMNAVLPFGTSTKSSASSVTIPPCTARMPIWTPALFRRWSAGGSRPVRAAASRPRDGPAIHVTTDANAPRAMRSEMTGVPQLMPQWSKNALNARLMPSVTPSADFGTATEIASVGRMKTPRMSTVAMAIERGKPRPGLRRSFACTALTSMPAYASTFETMSTMDAIPVQGGMTADASSVVSERSPVPSQTAPSTMSRTAGRIVPKTPLHDPTLANRLPPASVMSVDPQYRTRITTAV
ncbi:Uncharacterised protein [Mycobacteroides abscessus]|nr:Uncharacterised protein [Mycobacteroides abscessus]